MFTIRIKPYEGESLFSFLLRYAKPNGISFLSLWNMISRFRYAQMSEVNRLNFVPKNMIDLSKLQLITGIPEEHLMSCTFYNFVKVFHIDSDPERARFMSGVIREDLHYCPKCLLKNRIHKLVWQIKDIDICTDHNLYLLDTCTKCNKKIKYSEITEIDLCPHCGHRLSNIDYSLVEIKSRQNQYQDWLNNAWTSLLLMRDMQIEPNQIAIKLIFLLNDRQNVFDRTKVMKALIDPNILPTLLQHARGTLTNARVLHISYLLNILYMVGINISEFFALEVPREFIDSLIQKTRTIKEEAACKAHWCKNYNKSGLLIKTGTTVKSNNNGGKMHYYLACPECGCDYAFDEAGNMLERTYFIRGYDSVKRYLSEDISLRKLSEIFELTVDKLQRCIAYFSTRKIPEFDKLNFANELDNCLLEKCILALQNGVKIKEIEKWNDWKNYNDFLIYRYHEKVIKAELNMKRKDNERIPDDSNRKQIEYILKFMLEHNIDITLGTVCKRLGVVPETIRNWECNEVIAEMKRKQKIIREERKIREIYKNIEKYLKLKEYCIIKSSDIYEAIQIGRTVLWRTSPELTAYIHKQVLEHNRKL